MNKFTKSLIATGLSVATVLPNTNMVSNAWTPTTADWVNVDELNEKGILSLSNKQCKKIFNCDTCTMDAVKFDHIGKYVDDLNERYNELVKAPDSLENRVDVDIIIRSSLRQLSGIIKEGDFNNNNFLYVSANHYPGDPDVTVNLENKDQMQSSYNQNELNSLIDKKINPILKNIDTYMSVMDKKDIPKKSFFWKKV